MGIPFRRAMATILSVLLALILTACAKAPVQTLPPTTPVTEPPVLTAVRYMDALPGNWSVESAQTPEKEFLRSLTTAPLYHVENGAVVPGIASMPEDVTEQYLGTWGIPMDVQRGYAFRISLAEDVYWEDGTAVTAEDVVFAIHKLLEDYRWLAGAEEFAAGWERETDQIISLEAAGFDSVAAAREAGYHRFYVDMAEFWGLEAGWSSTDDRTRVQDYAMAAGLGEMFVTSSYLYSKYLADGMSYDHLQPEFVGITAEPENRMTLEDVGILATADREILIVAAEPMTAQTAALRLAGLCLFKQELYADTYATSAQTYCSYGPYRVISASAEEILLERNEYWQRESKDETPDRIQCLPQ